MNIHSTMAPVEVARTLTAELREKLKAAALDDATKGEVEKMISDQENQIQFEVPNTFVYRAAVIGVLLVCVLIVAGAIFQPSQWTNFPEFLKLTLSTAIGAIAGMIVPTAKG